MTLVKEGDTEYLWVADNGRKREASLGYDYPTTSAQFIGRVVKMTLDGNLYVAEWLIGGRMTKLVKT